MYPFLPAVSVAFEFEFCPFPWAFMQRGAAVSKKEIESLRSAFFRKVPNGLCSFESFKEVRGGCSLVVPGLSLRPFSQLMEEVEVDPHLIDRLFHAFDKVCEELHDGSSQH